MGIAEMGELADVDVRKLWDHEAHDFTPWLAKQPNLSRLSGLLGVELELEATEKQISGGYRADIVCKNLFDDSRVLIENQLEWSDIHHLGQVMAYLSGLDAKMVIWVARGFDDAHLSALRWLNEHTADEFSFFAVRVGAVKIRKAEAGDGESSVSKVEDSVPAPTFEVIERPNNWDRQVRSESQGLSELGQWRRDFWEHLRKRHPETPVLRPGYAGSNVNFKISDLNIRISWWLSKGTNVGIFLAGIDKAHNVKVVAILNPYRSALNSALRKAQNTDSLGADVDVVVDPDETCSVRLYLDPYDRTNWDKIADWLESRRNIYWQVLTGPPED